MSTTQTLEQWAAKTAPTLRLTNWPFVEYLADDKQRCRVGEYMDYMEWFCTPEQAQALVSYRDSVASNLDCDERKMLLSMKPSVHINVGVMWRERLVDMVSPDGITDFGQEVARVIRATTLDTSLLAHARPIANKGTDQ